MALDRTGWFSASPEEKSVLLFQAAAGDYPTGGGDGPSISAVDREGEILEVFARKRRNHKAAIAFLECAMKRYI